MKVHYLAGSVTATIQELTVVELLLVEIELGREIVNYTSKNNVS